MIGLAVHVTVFISAVSIVIQFSQFPHKTTIST